MARAERMKVSFPSGGDRCAAWHHPGTNGGCVVMAGGFAVTKEPGTDRFAAAFQEAGFSVLAFDYRRLGESSGEPRLVLSLADQRDDWDAAIACAGALPEVDPDRVALWGFSVSGGLVLEAAATDRRVAAVISQTPNADGRAATRNALRYQSKLALLRVLGRGVLDAVGGRLGRPPRLVALAGPRGSVSLLSTPDAQEGDRALNPGNRYPDWEQAVAARSALRLGGYRPGRVARDIHCPLLVVVADGDQTALAEPGVQVAEDAPQGEVVHLMGNHYAPFLEGHAAAVDAEIGFLRRHLGAGQELRSA